MTLLFPRAKQYGKAFPLPRIVVCRIEPACRIAYFFLLWIMSCMIGDKMISIA
jgi:hypothetical protein